MMMMMMMMMIIIIIITASYIRRKAVMGRTARHSSRTTFFDVVFIIFCRRLLQLYSNLLNAPALASVSLGTLAKQTDLIAVLPAASNACAQRSITRRTKSYLPLGEAAFFLEVTDTEVADMFCVSSSDEANNEAICRRVTRTEFAVLDAKSPRFFADRKAYSSGRWEVCTSSAVTALLAQL